MLYRPGRDERKRIHNSIFLLTGAPVLPAPQAYSGVVINTLEESAANATTTAESSATVLVNGEKVPVYRAGNDFNLKPGEFKLTPNGPYPARGLSLNTDPLKLPAGAGEPTQIMSIPEELQIIKTPRTGNEGHCDCLPIDLTTSEWDFQQMLYQINK